VMLMAKAWSMVIGASTLLTLLTGGLYCAPPLLLSWPTPNPAFARGMGYSAFVQKTGPDKEFSSGVFGCVRNNGYKFHEGLDLYPVKRDRNGQAEDRVFAAMKGTVVHLNKNSAHSAYGKYLVMEHSHLQPSLYTLYAHLASIEPNLRKGSIVDVAKSLGKMGNSASYFIPLERTHLHFEIGLRLTDDFQQWFSRKNFKTPNRHGNFSGFNLVGIDPIPFYASFQKKSFAKPIEYLRSLPIQTKVRIKTKKVPDFVKRYPTLAPDFKIGTSFKAWDCSFGPFGIPLRLDPSNQSSTEDPMIRILSFDLAMQSKPCRKLVLKEGSKFVPSDQLKTYLELIFGLKLG